jgi:hypothetical protein
MSDAISTAALTIAAGGSLALVLDASESAVDQQGAISTLVTSLLTALPARVTGQLFFLGNPRPYPPGDFPLKASAWFAENRGRASILAPVAEVLAGMPEAPVAIIGAGPIFDLEDWADSPLLARATLVAMGESLQGGADLALEITTPSSNDLFQRVYDPVTTVRIGGAGFMPLAWSHPGYKLANVAGAFMLVAERQEDFNTTVRYLGEAQAVATLASGQTRDVALVPAPAPIADETMGQLTPAEAAIFSAALRREAFPCPCCGQAHPWDTLICLAGSTILGKPVYPALQAAAGHFVLLRADGDAVAYRVHPADVLPLGDGRVAVREGKRATIYAQIAERWTVERTLEAYQALEGGAHVILV